MTIAVYAGTFDPFTYGHKSVADNALSAFQKLIVAVGANRSKSPFMSPERRKWGAELYFQGDDRVSVHHFSGFLVDFCAEISEREKQAVVMVRGLRALSDFEAEMALAAANRKMRPEIPTVFIPTTTEFAFVSSTTVREIAALGKKTFGAGASELELLAGLERLTPYVKGEIIAYFAGIIHDR